MSKTTAKPRSKFKKALLRFGVLFVVLALLVAFAPTFVNWGLGQSILRSKLQQHINGTVAFDHLDLGWIGPQTIDGLRITDTDGNEAANLDIDLSAGLFALWLGTIDLLEVDITGTLTGQIREDGSTTLIDLVVKGEPTDETDAESPKPHAEAPLTLSGIPPTKIRLNDITVHLREQHNDSPRTIDLIDLRGELAYLPGDSVSLQLQAEMKSAGKTGSFSVNGRFAHLFDADGVFTPAGASGRLQAELHNLMLPLAERQTELQSASFSITSENLTEKIELAIRVDALIDGNEAGRLQGDLVAHNIITTDGAIDFSLDRITGRIQGRSVPTTLLQFALQGTPILVERDIGPTLDIDASFSPGAQKEVSLTLSSPKINAELVATVDSATRALTGKRFRIDATIDPALISAISNVSIDRPVTVVVEIPEFSLPPIGETGRFELGALAASGFVEAKDPFVVTAQDDSFPPTDIDQFRVDFDTTRLDAGLHLTALVGPLQLETEVVRTSDALHVKQAQVALTITPKLASTFLANADTTIVLSKPTTATIDLEPFDLPEIDPYRYGLPTRPILATITTEETSLENVPGLVEPISLRRFKANITADIEAQDYAIEGNAIVIRAAHNQTLTRLKFDITAGLVDGTLSPRGTLTLDALQIVYLERMIGSAKGTLSDWIGNKGSVVAAVNWTHAGLATTLTADLPYLKGEFRATLVDDLVSITSDASTLTLQKSALESALNPKSTSKKSEPTDRVFTVPADVPVSLAVKTLRFPLAMLQDKPFDTADVDIDLTLTGGPLQLVDAAGKKSGLGNMTITVTSNDLAKGIAFAMNETTMTGDSADAGAIDFKGKITNLVSEQKTLQFDQGKLDVTAEVTGAPTHVADAFLGLDGLLVAAVGPKMGTSFRAIDFSSNSGSIRGKLTTTNGSIEGRIVGRDNALILPRSTPLQAELQLTPPLRERLLAKIHPVLADIRSTEHPVRVSAGGARLPLDGDVSRLKADIEITIGNVEFDSGSVTLGLLTILNASNAKTIPGRIEPIIAKIRKGVVTYDRFEVIIDKYTMAYSGKIDLNTQTVDIRTEIPLDALAVTIKELRGYADQIVVPLVTRGKFGHLKTRIDPDFDMVGAIAKAGLSGLLKEKLGGKDLPLGKLLDGIFKGRDKR